MSEAYAFELPENNAGITTQLIESIPDDYGHLQGQLDAPLRLIDAGEVARIGWKFQQFVKEIQPASLLDHHFGTSLSPEQLDHIWKHLRAGFLELVAQRKLPLFLRFEHAGQDGKHILPLSSAKWMACQYIGMGYTGDLEFRGEGRCDIHLGAYEAMFPSSQRDDPRPLMEIPEVREAFESGNEVFIQAAISKANPRGSFPPLVYFQGGGAVELSDTCRRSGLKEIDPSIVEPGYSYQTRL